MIEPFDPTPADRKCEECGQFDGTTEYRNCVGSSMCDRCHDSVCGECDA